MMGGQPTATTGSSDTDLESTILPTRYGRNGVVSRVYSGDHDHGPHNSVGGSESQTSIIGASSRSIGVCSSQSCKPVRQPHRFISGRTSTSGRPHCAV